jgi:hypothetical protein
VTVILVSLVRENSKITKYQIIQKKMKRTLQCKKRLGFTLLLLLLLSIDELKMKQEPRPSRDGREEGKGQDRFRFAGFRFWVNYTIVSVDSTMLHFSPYNLRASDTNHKASAIALVTGAPVIIWHRRGK